jgi:hypothetical protein
MDWWLAWLTFVVAFVLLGFVGYHFSVRTLRFFTAACAVIVIVFVTRYGVTHSGGGSADLVNSFIYGFNHLGTAFFQPLLGRHVQVPGQIGWLVIVVALVFGYRELEVWAMRSQPPVVNTSALVTNQQDAQPSGASDGPDQPDEALTDTPAWLMAELKFRLPAVAVRAPAILPGGTRPNELASIAENSGFKGSPLAGAIISFFGTLWPNPRRYLVRVWIEGGKRSGGKERGRRPAAGQDRTPGSTRVTVDLEDPRTGASIAACTLVAADIDSAASVVAGYVGRHIFKQDPTAGPWCVGSFDGDDLAGLLLAAQQRVIPESATAVRRSRREQIGILERCRLDSGVARYELAQLYDLEGQHARALRLHALNRADYPRFYRGRYRLGMSLEMIANPAFRLPDGEIAEMRDSLAILDRYHLTTGAECMFDRYVRDKPRDKLPAGLRQELLTAAAKELRDVRRQLTLGRILWRMFVYRDERMIRTQYLPLGQRECFHDGARVAELLVAVRQSLLDEELRCPGPGRVDRHTKRAMNIVAAVAGDCAEIRLLLNPADKPDAREPRPGKKATNTRWLYWQCRSPSWQAAYNAACLYAALEQRPASDQDKKNQMARHVVASLRRVVDDRDCEMERPWDWISTDPDFRRLKWSSKDFMSFRHAQLDRDYPAQKKTCPFCRARAADVKITGEYLFTGWASELAAPGGTGPDMPDIRCERSVSPGSPGSQDETAGPWPVAEVAGHSRRAVCDTCHGGWMASLEGAARPFLTPMIKGSEMPLTTEDQITLATWAVLKAAVFEHVWTHDPILTSADCETIMTQKRPPAGVQVRLAQAKPDGEPLRAYGRVCESGGQGDKAVSVTITIGRLAVQVFGGPGAGPQALRTAGRAGADFVGIFPAQPETVRWPPSAPDDEILLN